MKIRCYLVVTASGSVRAVKNQPSLNPDEISVGLNLEIPNSLFRRPRIEATVVVDESAVAPAVIEAQTVDAVKQAIEHSTGFDVRVSVAEKEEV